jgi:hypothetical protein
MFTTELFEDQAKNVKVIYPGRFQPWHSGHAAVYNHLVSKYGLNNVFIVTSDKQDGDKSPFSFEEKKRMMMLTGIDPSHIVMSTQPYRAMEVVSTFTPDTVLLFAVSAKDMAEDPRFQFAPKKDGSASYFQPFTDIKKCVPFAKHAYMVTVPTFTFTVLGKPANSASQIRAQFGAADDETQKKIVADLFGKFDHRIYTIMRSKLVHNPAPVTESKNAKSEFTVADFKIARFESWTDYTRFLSGHKTSKRDTVWNWPTGVAKLLSPSKSCLLSESADTKNDRLLARQFSTRFKALDQRDSVIIKKGNSISVLSSVLDLDKKSIELRGFVKSKKIVAINTNADGSIDVIEFDDGSQFPERNELTYVFNQDITNTIFFADESSSSRAYTEIWMMMSSMEGSGWNISNQLSESSINESYTYSTTDPVANADEAQRIADLKRLRGMFNGNEKRARYLDSKGLLKATKAEKEFLYKMTDALGNLRPRIGNMEQPQTEAVVNDESKILAHLEEQFGEIYPLGTTINGKRINSLTANKKLYLHLAETEGGRGIDFYNRLIAVKLHLASGIPLTESVKVNEVNPLFRLLDTFNNPHQVQVGDKLSIIEVSAWVNAIYLDGFIKQKEVVEIHAGAFVFSDGSSWPQNTSIVRQTSTTKQCLYFHSKSDAEKCLTAILMFGNKIGDWAIHNEITEETMTITTNESANDAEYFDNWHKWDQAVRRAGGTTEHSGGGRYNAIWMDGESFGLWDENTGEGYIDYEQEQPYLGNNDSLGEDTQVDEARGDTIEAHGIRGMKRQPWRRSFKDYAAMEAWCEKYDAEVYGTRDTDAAKQGKLAPAMGSDEQVNELSTGTLNRYVGKAKNAVPANLHQASNRIHGIMKAKEKEHGRKVDSDLARKGDPRMQAEGYWQDSVKAVEKKREAEKGKTFEKNPASHDRNGVYKGDKDLAGNPVPKKVDEAGKKGTSAHAKEVAAKSKKYYDDQALKNEKAGETYNYGNAKVTKLTVPESKLGGVPWGPIANEGRFVKGPGGVPLDRQGNPIPPKVKEPRAPAGPRRDSNGLTKEDYSKVWRKIEDVVSNIFPDGDPIDWLAPWLNRSGIRDHHVGEVLDKASRMNGYKDIYAYYDSFKSEDYGYNQGVKEGVVDSVRAMNYNRLAKRSGNKVDNAFDKMHDYDFTDPDRFPHEKEFADQMDKKTQRLNKAKQLGAADKEQGVKEEQVNELSIDTLEKYATAANRNRSAVSATHMAQHKWDPKVVDKMDRRADHSMNALHKADNKRAAK